MTEHSTRFELVLRPASARFDTDDDAWIEQENDFAAGLGESVGGVRRRSAPVADTKGGAESIILALGSAGAFAAATEFFRAWLGRDRTRRIEVSWTVDGREEKFTVTGTAIDSATFDELAEKIQNRLER